MAMLKGGPYEGFQYDVYYDQGYRDIVAYIDPVTDKPEVVSEDLVGNVVNGHNVEGYTLRDDEYVWVSGRWERKDQDGRELWWRREEATV